jgi:hypothetical protein
MNIHTALPEISLVEQMRKKPLKITPSWGCYDDFRFFNDGNNTRLFFAYHCDGFTQFMFKQITFKSPEEMMCVEAIEINFLRLKHRSTVIYATALMRKTNSKPNTLYFNSDLDYEVLDIPDDADVVGIQVIGKNLKENTFEIVLPHFLV